MHHWITALATGVAASTALGQGMLPAPIEMQLPYAADSGVLANVQPSSEVLWREVVHVQDAQWLRVYFGDVELAPGSRVRLTAALDGERQTLDAAGLAMWSNASAYFNGDTVTVELIAAGDSPSNRVRLDSVGVPALSSSLGEPGVCGICGLDDRVTSNELWTGRLIRVGCTANVVSEQSCLITAGHCINGNALLLQFDVPTSNPNTCGIRHPPVDDQFPIVSWVFQAAGIGNDWAVLTAGVNGVGELPFDRYGVMRPLATTRATVGTPISITGYGTDVDCLLNKTQQTDSGTISGVGPQHYEFSVDVTNGNSGSAIIANGEVIGILTNCNVPGVCPNFGGRIDVSDLQLVLDTTCFNVAFTFPGGQPELISPDGGDTIEVHAAADGATPVAGTGVFYVSVDGSPFVGTPMDELAPHEYEATFPATSCGAIVEYYFEVSTTAGGTATSPTAAPDGVHSAIATPSVTVVFADDFQVDQGWTVSALGGLTDGAWERAVPISHAVCDRGNPDGDADGSGTCYVTDNSSANDCNSDVDDGTTVLTSPVLDATTAGETIVSYWRWFSNAAGDAPFSDTMITEVSDDGGGSWSTLEVAGPNGADMIGGWFRRHRRLSDAAQATPDVQVRFRAGDLGNASVVEAGLDGFVLRTIPCIFGCPWDINDDGVVSTGDLLLLLATWGIDPGGPPDFDADGVVGTSDLLILLANWGPCP